MGYYETKIKIISPTDKEIAFFVSNFFHIFVNGNLINKISGLTGNIPELTDENYEND